MKEAFENLQNAEVEPREKLKVTKADIVVALPLGEPYFNIHYREVGNDYDNIGFSSYDLNNVIRWREEMEIVSEVESECGNGWIPCDSGRMPVLGQKVLACINPSIAEHEIIITKYDDYKWWHDGTVIAWMPLPSTYKPTTD